MRHKLRRINGLLFLLLFLLLFGTLSLLFLFSFLVDLDQLSLFLLWHRIKLKEFLLLNSLIGLELGLQLSLLSNIGFSLLNKHFSELVSQIGL